MQILIRIYGWLLALPLYLLLVTLHATCRIEFENEEVLQESKNHILAMWHHNNLPYFIVFIRHKVSHIWINHGAWYMKPVHVILRLIGVEKLALGSTGSGGREAADQVVDYLKRGYSTHINPDGPSGPALQARKGALHLSSQSGVPIVPVRIETPLCITFRGTWDKKRLPLPFSKIIVRFGEPFVASKVDDQELSNLEKVL